MNTHRHYSMESIPTVFRKTRFRSRIEARWAVLFSTMRLKYRYEPKVFSFPQLGLMYLPDFQVWKFPMGGAGVLYDRGPVWCEVKPTTPTAEEVLKGCLVALRTGSPVVIVWELATDVGMTLLPTRAFAKIPSTAIELKAFIADNVGITRHGITGDKATRAMRRAKWFKFK